MTQALHPARIIVVEDSEPLREEMVFQLEMAGFSVRGAHDARALDALLAQEPCDLLVLDLNLPGEDGFSIARRLCDRQRRGIIMLTARDDIEDKLRGFTDGADIYLVKPVDRRELAACIRALHRRLVPASSVDSGWRIKQDARQLLSPDGQVLDLTPQDLTVLALLIEQPGSTRSRKELVCALGINFINTPEGRINTMVSRLRQKLTTFDAELRIVAWRNQGYSYVGPELIQL
jgi:DNA-binding response OmpR family regulator